MNKEVEKCLTDDEWRLNNLYCILDKRGRKIKFSMNWAQQELHDNLWYCNIILKARQLGISTYVCMLFLDKCLFNEGITAGIICHKREDSEIMFQRIKFAYDSLDPYIKSKIKATSDSARELSFSNGSTMRVGNSMRGSTLQYLHISEFGKLCAESPDKATEVMTGALNTVAAGQFVFIESTAEGKEGYFYDMCQKSQAQKHSKHKLTELDYRFHFFPWWREPAYRLGSPVSCTEDALDYFKSLEGRGITLDPEQKNWYAAVEANQRDNMMREFPSTPEEAWEQSNEGAYYAKNVTTARLEGRISSVPYDEAVPVSTAWDLGYNDSTSIWWFQLVGKEIHVIDYIEGSGESLAHWLGVVKSKPYVYEKHLAPHDIMAHEYTSGMNRQSSARQMGINFIAVPKAAIVVGIDKARGIFNRCWFDEKKCSAGIKCLENYKKEWDDKHGCWKGQPLHNWASHCFIGQTEVLTIFGTRRIMDLSNRGVILTSCGWKEYRNPRITRKNAPLVEVAFENDLTVRCTPDHLFKTASGWISAENLERGIMIQSGSTQSLNTLMESYIEFFLERSISKTLNTYTEKFGRTPLERFLKDVIYIIETVIDSITNCPTWNVYQRENIYKMIGKEQNLISQIILQTSVELRRAYGIHQKKADCGINDMQTELNLILSGKENQELVSIVHSNLKPFLEKMELAIKNSVAIAVNHCTVQSVRKLPWKSDVWCLTVPGVEDFCLSNGAIVHNCADAFRTLASGLVFFGQKETDATNLGKGPRAYRF